MQNKKISIVISLVFLILLCCPVLNMVLKIIPEKPAPEGRTMTSFPEFDTDWVDFPGAFDAYFNDNFGFRNDLVRFSGQIRSRYLSTSITDQVILGKDGWLFLDAEEVMEDYHGEIQLSKSQMIAIQENLLELSEYLQKNGIELVLIVPPNPQTIYGDEYLPDYEIYNTGLPSRFDQILDHIDGRDELTIIDIRQELIEAQAQSEHWLYYQTDTHWNLLGAEVGYKAIIKELNSRGLSITTPYYEVVPNGEHFGDMARMMADYSIPPETNWEPALDASYEETYLEGNWSSSYFELSSNAPNDMSVSIFCDSFGIGFFKYLFGTFTHTSVERRGVSFLHEDIQKAMPDIVIISTVERGLRGWKNINNAEEVASIRRERLYAAAQTGSLFSIFPNAANVIELPKKTEQTAFYLLKLTGAIPENSSLQICDELGNVTEFLLRSDVLTSYHRIPIGSTAALTMPGTASSSITAEARAISQDQL